MSVERVLKDSSKVYFLFTSLMMLFPPLAYGLSAIYYGSYTDQTQFIGLIINYVLILILFLIGLLLISSNKIWKPNKKDLMRILFGLISNVIIYLFVFQYPLGIVNVIDIYNSTILILFFYFILINRKYINLELTILSIMFFVFYRVHMSFVYSAPYIENGSSEVGQPIKLIYVLVPLVTLGIYVYKIVQYKIKDFFGYSFMILTFISMFFIINDLPKQSKFFLTIFLIMPFIPIIDLIVTKFKEVNKLAFYLRMTTIVISVIVFRVTEYFIGDSYRTDGLYQYTFIMYASIFINIFEFYYQSRTTNELTDIKPIEEVEKEIVPVDEVFAQTNELQSVFVRVIDKPARKLIMKRGINATNYFELCQEIGYELFEQFREVICQPKGYILPEHLRKEHTSNYVLGVEVPHDYFDVLPQGFEMIYLVPCKMMVFEAESSEVDINTFNQLVERFNPTRHGFTFANFDAPQFIQQPKGDCGYCVGRPVKEIN